MAANLRRRDIVRFNIKREEVAMITIGLILRVLSVIAAAAIWSKDPGRRSDAQEVLRMTWAH